MKQIAKQINPSTEKKVLDFVRKGGILRPQDLQRKGLPSDYLWRLHKQGKLEKVGRGLYAVQGAELSEHQTVVQAALRVPHGVVCLLSALRFHDFTTQSTFEVWMAIDVKARAPKEEIIPLRIVRFSGKALTAGVETHTIEGAAVKVYNPAKTVADCFKYRNKIGLDVAIEALRECWRKKLATSDELWRYAKVCRVARVMRPYLESVV
ncbi:MAG TPA: type IV toxin-antitoxin system AbiEi family antitoxin domain-containing protein [Anaerolineales bacterium]|nr:type IV toxin-antitoxin system AbiEi family antitoxin domain-containing protein [Anaerolineales bacterium]